MGTAATPEAYLAALAGLPAMGPARLHALLDGRAPAAAWSLVSSGRGHSVPAVAARGGRDPAALAARWAAAARTTDLDDLVERHRLVGVRLLAPGGAAFPARLDHDPEPPVLLFAQGALAALDGPTVAVIGTRRCSHDGREVAFCLARDLARAGVAVISGLALGIDGAAHEGALAEPAAPPVAVVASGLDVIYPARHRSLWARVAAAGLVLSEAPLGTRPERWRFPARNRLIAALADVVVVVESHASGGSMHTVDAAIERDVPVMAVPGSVRNPAAAGTNRLLAEAAVPARDADDVLCALGLHGAGRHPPFDPRPEPAPGDQAVLDALGWAPTATEEVLRRSGLAPGAATAALLRLERDGWARTDGGWWERCAPPEAR